MKRILLVLALAICIAACDSQSPFPSAPSHDHTDIAQVTPVGTFADGTSQSVMATCRDWQSDKAGVLTINSGGLITARGSAAATITTTCQVVEPR